MFLVMMIVSSRIVPSFLVSWSAVHTACSLPQRGGGPVGLLLQPLLCLDTLCLGTAWPSDSPVTQVALGL